MEESHYQHVKNYSVLQTEYATLENRGNHASVSVNNVQIPTPRAKNKDCYCL